MTIDRNKLLTDIISQQFKVSHLEKKIDFIVLDSSKVNQKIKDSLGDDVIKNSDVIVGFVEKQSSTQEEPQNNDNTEDNKGEQEEVNESTKVQDLTSQMLSVPIKTSGNPTYGNKKKGKTAKPAAMPLDPIDREKGKGTPYTGKGGCDVGGEAVDGGDAGGAEIAEAETEATGADLVEKVRKCVQKIFKSQESETNKVEIKEVEGISGAYYFALKFGKQEDNLKKTEEK